MSVSTYLPRRIVPGALYEVTDRTFSGQHLLTPTLRPEIESCLWRAAAVARVGVFGYVFMSNHYHLLVAAPGPKEFAWFLQLLHSSVAAVVNRGRGRRDKVWARRADVVPVSDEPSAQLRRLAYILANGVKEGAVAHPMDWTGPHCARDFQGPDEVLSGDAKVVGVAAVISFKEAKKASVSRKMRQGYTMHSRASLRPLPHLAHLPRATWLGDMRRMCDQVAAHADDRESWLEPHLIDPTLPRPPAPPRRPPNPDRNSPANSHPHVAAPRATPAPTRDKARERFPVHAFDPSVRCAMQADLEAFHEAYAAVSAAFRAGDTTAEFPPHCMKPHQPWMPGAAMGWLPDDVARRAPAADCRQIQSKIWAA